MKNYKKREINCIHFDDSEDFIRVSNDYTERINTQVDLVIEEIIKRLGEFGLKPEEHTLKMSKPITEN